MSLTLYHGPAGGKKTDYLLQKIKENNNSAFDYGNTSCILIVPSNQAIPSYQKRLVKETKQQILMGESLLSLDQFLLKLLKLNLPRLHFATPRITRTLIRKLLFTKNYPSFEKSRFFFGFVSELAATLIHLKKNGLFPSETESLLFRHLTPEIRDLIRLFYDYEEILENCYYIDQGSLITKTLKLLKTGKLQLPQGLEQLFIDRLFPITLGERELIKEFHHFFPELKIHLTYSFDYQTSDDPYFYPAFSFLGELANRSEYFPPQGDPPPLRLVSFSNPDTELQWIADQISKNLQKGIPPESIGVILPKETIYHRYLSESLARYHIPCDTPYSPPVGSVLQQTDEKIPTLINLFIKDTDVSESKNKLPINNLLTALALKEQFDQEWNFEEELFLSEMKDSPLLPQWRETEFQRLKISGSSQSGGVPLLSLSEALAYDFDILYVTSFTESNYPPIQKEHPFYSHEMLSEIAMREILESPAYSYQKETHLLWQALLRTKKEVFLTYPRTLWDGKEQRPSRLAWPNRSEVYNTENESPTKIESKTLSFPKIRQTRFSLSALETYFKCPYQYYARYHLNLGKLPQEIVDIPPDTRGNLIHRILEQLFKKHEGLYREALDYDLYLNRLLGEVAPLVHDETQKSADFKLMALPLRQQFINRATQVISEYLKQEILLMRNRKKKTYPRYFEWAFGRGEIPPLRLKGDKGDIFISGRIDRIDIDEESQTFMVIDYKTSATLHSGKSIKEGEAFQIPVYLMAVESLLLRQHVPLGGIFISFYELSQRKGLAITFTDHEEILGKAYQITFDEWQTLKKKVSSTLIALTHRIRNSDFAPKPREPQICRSCDYRDICHYQAFEEGNPLAL